MNNVIRLLSRALGRTLYVRVGRNQMRVRHIESGREANGNLDISFSNSRLLVASSTLATDVLKTSIRAVLPNLGIAPVVIMHPLEMVEGGLSEIETKSLTDIGYAIGARQVEVIIGQELSDEEVIRVATQRFMGRLSA